jgi:hypothetical protein
LKRILVIVTAGVVVLACAASAYAALNTYTAKFAFTTNKAGTAKKPVPIGFTQTLNAAGTNGNRSAVLLDLKTSVYGLKANLKAFPTCAITTIANSKSDTSCPKGALVAKGYINATLGSANNFSKTDPTAAACDPALDVWNSGANTLAFFFVVSPAHNCLGGALKTGDVGPYPATVKQSGKNLVIDVPIPHTTAPASVDYPAPGLAGSLSFEHLQWLKSTTKKNGKTVAMISSVACKGGKRPFQQSFTATLPTAGPAVETKSVSGSAAC